MSTFEKLNAINVNDKTEKKNGLTYLSWAWAWAEFKKVVPDAAYTVYENDEGWNYHTDGRTAWVKTGVTVEGLEHIEYLPIMDYKNRSIPLEKITSFDVNKAIQRSLTKACARHGLGLYIYAGEDLPEEEQPAPKREKKEEPEIDMNSTIADTPSAAKNLASMVRTLEGMGATELMDDLRNMYGIKELVDTKKKDYREMVSFLQAKYDLMKGAQDE